MVSQLEETGAVPTRLALKRRSLKEELLMQQGRNKEEMAQRKTREVVIHGRCEEELVAERQGQDNGVLCDNRNILKDIALDKKSAAVVMKKPPLLKRRPVMREKQVQELKGVNLKELKVTKEPPKEGVSVKAAKLEEKTEVIQRLEQRLPIRSFFTHVNQSTRHNNIN